MKLFRPLLNLVILTIYLVRMTLFIIARVFGSIPGGVALCGVTVLWIEHTNKAPVLFYIPFVFVCLCRVVIPYLRVRSRPRFLQVPAPPAPPPPTAVTTQGWADDPDEATVIGRLNPKLRDLLRTKTDGATP